MKHTQETLGAVGITDYSIIKVQKVGDSQPICNDNVDAYIEEADYNGSPMTEEQLDVLNDSEFRGELIYEFNH